MMIRAQVLVFASVLSSMSGCHSEPIGSDAARDRSPDGQRAQAGSLLLTLDFEPEVESGKPVLFSVKLSNVGEEAETIEVPGGPILDVYVRGMNGKTLWNHFHDRFVPLILTVETIEPGGAIERSIQWDQADNDGSPVGPGTYLVSAQLGLQEPQLLTEARALKIVP